MGPNDARTNVVRALVATGYITNSANAQFQLEDRFADNSTNGTDYSSSSGSRDGVREGFIVFYFFLGCVVTSVLVYMLCMAAMNSNCGSSTKPAKKRENPELGSIINDSSSETYGATEDAGNVGLSPQYQSGMSGPR